jgi:hypothetical protein
MPRTDRVAIHIAIGAIAVVIAGQAPEGSQLKTMARAAGTLAVITTGLEVVTRND